MTLTVKSTIIKKIAMAMFIGLLGAGTLAAQPDPRDGAQDGERENKRMPGMAGRMEQMGEALDNLDLTEDQKAQIAELRDEFQSENAGALKEIGELEKELRRQMESGDREGAKKTREQIEAKSAALRESGKELRQQIAMILTDEQKAKLMTARENHEAEGKPGHCPEKKEVMDALNLTDGQKEQIKAMREQFQQENAGTLEKMKELAGKMRDQMESGDREGAKRTREELKKLRDQIAESGKALREKIAGILTDEQKAILAEHKDELQDCREEHKGERKGPGRRGNHPPATEGNGPADIQ